MSVYARTCRWLLVVGLQVNEGGGGKVPSIQGGEVLALPEGLGSYLNTANEQQSRSQMSKQTVSRNSDEQISI